jgi:cytochrome c oxidase subunit IV
MEDQFKINLNQNLWGLIFSFTALGLSEHYHLETLFRFALASSAIMLASVLATTISYTITYCRKKAGS